MDDYWKEVLERSRIVSGRIRHSQLRKKAGKSKPQPKKRRPSKQPFAGTYHEYVKSRQWKRKVMKARKHYGNKCCRCGSNRNLQVHHRHYRTLFRESMADLELVCGGCHLNHHEGKVLGVMDPLTRQFVQIIRGS